MGRSLDLEPTRGLREALENPARVDGLFISSATAKLTENLSIMATEENLTTEVQYNPNAVDALFEALGRTNDAIVVDLPRSRSEEHTSELQSLMRISYAVFCLKKKKYHTTLSSSHSLT